MGKLLLLQYFILSVFPADAEALIMKAVGEHREELNRRIDDVFVGRKIQIRRIKPMPLFPLTYTLAAAPCPTLVGGTAEAVVCGYSGVISTLPNNTHNFLDFIANPYCCDAAASRHRAFLLLRRAMFLCSSCSCVHTNIIYNKFNLYKQKPV